MGVLDDIGAETGAVPAVQVGEGADAHTAAGKHARMRRRVDRTGTAAAAETLDELGGGRRQQWRDT